MIEIILYVIKLNNNLKKINLYSYNNINYLKKEINNLIINLIVLYKKNKYIKVKKNIPVYHIYIKIKNILIHLLIKKNISTKIIKKYKILKLFKYLKNNNY